MGGLGLGAGGGDAVGGWRSMELGVRAISGPVSGAAR